MRDLGSLGSTCWRCRPVHAGGTSSRAGTVLEEPVLAGQGGGTHRVIRIIRKQGCSCANGCGLYEFAPIMTHNDCLFAPTGGNRGSSTTSRMSNQSASYSNNCSPAFAAYRTSPAASWTCVRFAELVLQSACASLLTVATDNAQHSGAEVLHLCNTADYLYSSSHAGQHKANYALLTFSTACSEARGVSQCVL